MPEDLKPMQEKMSELDLLDVDRTRQSHEQTLMAWIRTSTSLITFGFTVHEFFQFQMQKGQLVEPRLFGPREFGMTMTGIGLLALVMASVQRAISMRGMRARYGKGAFSISLLVAAMVTLLGLLAFLSVLFQ